MGRLLTLFAGRTNFAPIEAEFLQVAVSGVFYDLVVNVDGVQYSLLV
jgi:hypothetical protein